MFFNKGKAVNPKWKRSEADTPLQVTGHIQLVIQLGQKVTRTGYLILENLAVDMLLSTEFIDKNMKCMYPNRGIIVSTASSPVGSETLSDATLHPNTDDSPKVCVNKKIRSCCAVYPIKRLFQNYQKLFSHWEQMQEGYG